MPEEKDERLVRGALWESSVVDEFDTQGEGDEANGRGDKKGKKGGLRAITADFDFFVNGHADGSSLFGSC